MSIIAIVIHETKERNFYIYSQWFQVLTAFVSVVSFTVSLVHFPALLHQPRWLTGVYVMIVQLVTSILTILYVSPFFNIDGENLLQYEYRVLAWIGLSIANFICVYFGWRQSLIVAVLLLVVCVMHFVAYAKCQSIIVSRLVGGDGHRQMTLYVQERGRWVDYWDRLFQRRGDRVQIEE